MDEMNEKNEELTDKTADVEKTDGQENEEEIDDEFGPRPPVDPKNKLYTFLSLLIFAACYAGYQFISSHYSYRSVMYQSMPQSEELAVMMEEAGIGRLPEGCLFSYARLNKRVDNGYYYAAIILPEDITDMEIACDYARELLPYETSEVLYEQQFELYTDANMNPRELTGCIISDSADEDNCGMVFEEYGRFCLVIRTDEYSSELKNAFEGGVTMDIK